MRELFIFLKIRKNCLFNWPKHQQRYFNDPLRLYWVWCLLLRQDIIENQGVKFALSFYTQQILFSVSVLEETLHTPPCVCVSKRNGMVYLKSLLSMLFHVMFSNQDRFPNLEGFLITFDCERSHERFLDIVPIWEIFTLANTPFVWRGKLQLIGNILVLRTNKVLYFQIKE